MNELEWDQIPLKSGASGIEDFWKKSQIKSRKNIEYFFLFFVFFDFPQNEGFQESSVLPPNPEQWAADRVPYHSR